jgi:hypothetical protein
VSETATDDFTKIIPALWAVGFSNYDIAYFCRPCSDRTVANWASGKTEPPYSKGRIIVGLYEKHCEKNCAVPRES